MHNIKDNKLQAKMLIMYNVKNEYLLHYKRINNDK